MIKESIIKNLILLFITSFCKSVLLIIKKLLVKIKNSGLHNLHTLMLDVSKTRILVLKIKKLLNKDNFRKF